MTQIFISIACRCPGQTLCILIQAGITGQPPLVHPTSGITPDMIGLKAANRKRLTLLCNLAGGSSPLSFSWTVNGELLRAGRGGVGISRRNGQLTVTHASEGSYQCIISNPFGTAVTIPIVVKFSVVGWFESVETGIKYLTGVVSNEPFRIPCPPHSYSYGVTRSWTNARLQLDRRLMVEPNGDLFISNVVLKDSVWTGLGTACKISNQYGEQIESSKFRITNITKGTTSRRPPKIRDIHGPSEIGKDNEFNITCIFTGYPTPILQWFVNGGLRRGQLNQLHFPKNVLQVGIYNITCQAVQGNTSDSRSMMLRIGDKPRFTGKEGTIDSFYGQTIILSCDVSSEDPVKKLWYYNGKLWHNRLLHSESSLDKNESLRIRHIHPKDSGMYQCLYKNKFGSGITRTWLRVYNANQPFNLSLSSNCSDFTTELSWSMSSSIVNSYLVEFSSEFEAGKFYLLTTVSDGSARRVRLTNLSPWANLSFRVIAVNNLGTGLPSNITLTRLCQTPQAAPKIYPEGLHAEPGIGPGHLRIHWKPLKKIQRNGENCSYALDLRLKGADKWNISETVKMCGQQRILLRLTATYTLYEIRIKVINSKGMGPVSPSVEAFTGQSPPYVVPYNTRVVAANSSSVTLAWDKPVPKTGSIDNFVIYVWIGPPIYQIPQRRKRSLVDSSYLFIPRNRKKVEANQTMATIQGLKRLTLYSFYIKSRNSGGESRSGRIILQKTTDKVDSFYLVNITILNEKFTQDLNDKMSPRYVRMSEALQTGIVNHMKKVLRAYWFKELTILSFQPGSVVALLQVGAANPNITEVKLSFKNMTKLGEYSVDGDSVTIRLEPAARVLSVMSNIKNTTGAEVRIPCIAEGPVGLGFSWFMNNQKIEWGPRWKISSVENKSVLTIRKAVTNDTGYYACQVSKGNQVFRRMVSYVFVLPTAKLVPSIATREEVAAITWIRAPEKLQYIDSGITSAVWGVSTSNNIWSLNPDRKTWSQVHDSSGVAITKVSPGEGGVWAIAGNLTLYREGSIGGGIGSKWTKIPVASDPFIHIDSGPFGIVNAVSNKGKIFSRWGISKENPQGLGWDEILRNPSFSVFRSVACGSFGCWATDQAGRVSFRHGITPHQKLGTFWHRLSGFENVSQLQCGPGGMVWGKGSVNGHGIIVYRVGMTARSPVGSHWVQIQDGPSDTDIVTVGTSGVYGLTRSGDVWLYNGANHTISCQISDERFRRQGSRFVMEKTSLAEVISGPYPDIPDLLVSNLSVPATVDKVEKKFVCLLTAKLLVYPQEEDEPSLLLSQQGTLSTKSLEATLYIIKKDAPTCDEETFEGVTWHKTIPNNTVIRPCPGNATGNAFRRCEFLDGAAMWSKHVNLLNCASDIFLELDEKIDALNAGFKPEDNVTGILVKLDAATKIRNRATQPPIYGRDLEISVGILSKALQQNQELQNHEYVRSYVSVANNLVDPVNNLTWRRLRKVGEKKSRDLLRAVDDFGQQIGRSWLNGTRISESLNFKNIGLKINLVTPASKIKEDGLLYQYNETSISLPPEMFSANETIVVVNVVYLTFNDIFPLAAGNVSLSDKWNVPRDSNLNANTTIVSSTVRPLPQVLPLKVKIVLQNKNVFITNPLGTCVSWKPGFPPYWTDHGCEGVPEESNDKITTCQCNHLTCFAALMDPFGTPISAGHKKALSIISIVGCSISLVAVLATIVITLLFWRVLKGPRTVVLINLCLSIAGSCVLVISESSARGGTATCTVMAVLLHFALLSVFAWMLCEGVLLYILLVKVFGGSPNEKVKYFLIFGWCFPALIVAISMGATKLKGYGYKEACWLSIDNGLIWGFIVPAITVIIINIAVFVMVIRKMMGTKHVQNKNKMDKLRTGVKATAVVLPLLGITWIFGLMAFGSAAVAIKYLFAIFNSLQGLMIFIFHCVLNKQVQDALKRKYGKGSSAGTNTTSRDVKRPPKNKNKLKELGVRSLRKTKGNENEMLMEAQQKNKDLEAVTSQDDTRNTLIDSDVELKIKEKKSAVQQVESKSQVGSVQAGIPDKDHVIASSDSGAGLKDANDAKIQAEDAVTHF